jgi:hypothetical protein
VITVDFTDVESGGAMPTPDGPYTAVMSHAEQTVSQAGNDMIEVRWKTHMGSTVFDNVTLVPQALWVLRTMLECAGYEIPDAEYDLDVDALIGIEVGLDIVNEEYENKDRPKVAGYMPMKIAEAAVAEVWGEDADDAAPGGLQGANPDDEEEEYEDEEEDEEEEAAPKRRAKTKTKKAAAKKKAGPLKIGARVTFEGEDEEEVRGVIEFLEDGMATVVDDEEGEWEIPIDELTKA